MSFNLDPAQHAARQHAAQAPPAHTAQIRLKLYTPKRKFAANANCNEIVSAQSAQAR